MTPDTGCLVRIVLPGRTVPVVAGRFGLSGGTDGEAVGSFAYDRGYAERADAVELDPVELAGLASGRHETTRGRGVFGSLRDACPDAWGRRLVEKRLGAPATCLSEPDYMLAVPDDGAGALVFGAATEAPGPEGRSGGLARLEALMATADRVIAEDAAEDGIASSGSAAEEEAGRLRAAGTALGGARPKATVEDEGALWVAKFALARDRWNNPRVEHATMRLARLCGLHVAETRVVAVGGRDVLLVRRFDRVADDGGFGRIRMISALTMLGAEEDDPREWSYLRLADEARWHAAGRQRQQLAELFRRMAFNALVSNTDDHPRNHAFLASGGGWGLSPAYDLTPTPAIGHERRLAMACGTGGRDATRENLLSGCDRFMLDRAQAEAVVDGMAMTVAAGWQPCMREAGVTDEDAGKVRSAFCNPGFRASAD